MHKTSTVRIVRLPDLRVAYLNAFSASPERDAWTRLMAWAEGRGLLKGDFRLFGYNNPSPQIGKIEYGYDVLITVGPEIEADDTVHVRVLPGATYAVLSVEGLDRIEPGWKRLVAWGETSDTYRRNPEVQWLEEHLSPMDTPMENFRLDLFMPVAER